MALWFIFHKDNVNILICQDTSAGFVSSDLNNFDENDVSCLDNDSDGFYNWGIGPKPPTCPTCPDLPDGDDNNSGIGPIDEYGFCRIIGTYNSSFELTMNNWKQSPDDDCDWVKYYGPTASYPTSGPGGTPDESTYYIYMNASICGLNNGAFIESPLIDLSDECAIKMTFAYHKNTEPWGNNETDDSKLSLDISYDEGQSWIEDYWFIMKDQGNEWHYVTMYLPPEVNKVRFYAYVGWINWFNDIALDDITIGPVSEDDITITGNEIWTADHYEICQNIVIEPEASLTLTNSAVISMMEDKKIIVKPSGTLTIDNAIITDLNDLSWQGIEVWGNRSASQHSLPGQLCAQGKLIMENNAVIENAIHAVELWKPDDYTKTGGIILANDATFRNNTNSIHALYYRNFNPVDPEKEMDYVGVFNNCTFELNVDYLADHTFYKHIDLACVNGLRFNGCTFLMDSDDGVSQWNLGIAAYDAGFRVNSICLEPIEPCPPEYQERCIFNGFNWAIGTYASGDSRYPCLVRNADFDNNNTGVYVSSVNNAIVLECNFQVGYDEAHIGDCGIPTGYGIDVLRASGFVIEDNYFIKNESAPLGNYAGIGVFSCPSLLDIIYRNEFTGLSYGNYAEGRNRYDWEDERTGVEYQCNDNSNNAVDFIVTAEYPQNAMIKRYQGDEENPSGNEFSQTAAWHFRNEGENAIDWFYCSGCANETPDPERIYTLDPIYWHAWGDESYNECPDHYGGGGHIRLTDSELQQKESDFAGNLNNFNSVSYLYESLIDGGNTNAELTDIQYAQPDDMWELRVQLLGHSPHLSQEVLRTMSDRTDVFPDDILLEILSANPDELKKDTLLDYLAQKESPLPSYMIDILRQVAAGVTYKTILQREMARYHSSKTQAAQDIIRHILFDSIVDLNQYRNWLDNLGNLEADKQIIASYLNEGDTANALSLLNLIPTLYGLEGDELDDFNDYKAIVAMQIEWKEMGKTIYDLDSTDILVLEDYAQNQMSTAGNIARNILSYAYNFHFCNCMHSNDSVFFKRSNASLFQSLNEAYGIKISAKPNPARTWIAFDFVLPDDESKGTINISDVSGQVIRQFSVSGKTGQEVWDVRNIDQGMYYFTLTSSGLSRSGKVIVN